TLEPQQRRLYEGALNSLIVDVQAVDDRQFQRRLLSFLARRAALFQICSHPTSVSDAYNEVPAKLRALDGLLDELVVRRREKIVLWSFYTASITAMVDRYCHLGVVRYDGEVSDIDERRDAVSRFQED